MIAIVLAIEIDISGDLGIRETVVAQSRGGVYVFNEGVADEGYAEPLTGNIICRHLLVKTKDDVWHKTVLSEKLCGTLSRIILGVKENKWAIGKCLKIDSASFIKMLSASYVRDGEA